MIGTYKVVQLLTPAAVIGAITMGKTFPIEVEGVEGWAHIHGPSVKIVREQRVLHGVIWFDKGDVKVFECTGSFNGSILDKIEVRPADDGSNV